MNIGKNLKELRLEFKLTQKAVAQIINVTEASYNRYENGQRPISIEILVKLADHYKVTLDELCDRKVN